MLHRDSTDIHRGAYVQATDPGAVGATILWIDTSGVTPLLKKRNDANTAWDAVGAAGGTGGGGAGDLLYLATVCI